MGVGKKCLEPGGTTPEHSTGRYQELVLGIEGEVSMKLGTSSEEVTVLKNQACYVPPGTRHSVVNKGTKRACYYFVYSLPEVDSHQE